MAPTETRQWILAKKPDNLPILSGPDATFKLTTKPLPELQDQQVLVKVIYLSNDPAQRLWIDPKITPDRLYTTPVEVGDRMASYAAVAEVIESKASTLPVGTLVSAEAGWSEYAVLGAETCLPFKSVPALSLPECVSLFGVASVTAYYGLVDIARAGPDDTVVISGAAGAVGSMAVQIAKHVLGCRKVIGIAGTDEKCKWVQSLGADICLNYKSTTFEADLKQAADGFVEVFFDNVGGKVLDLMLKLIKQDGRVAACGAIADYNTSQPYGITNWYHVIAMRLELRGFVILDALVTGRWDEITNILTQAYQHGQIKATEEGVTVVQSDFEDVPKTWMRLFDGRSSGKLLTQLKWQA